jgi:drug/metabolite transporter (DMT)-like permease
MPLGELTGLGSAFLWACNTVLLRWLSPRADVIALNALRCLIGAAVLLGLLLAVGRGTELYQVPLAPLGFLLGSVLLGLGVGDSFFFHALRLMGVVRAQPIAMSYPLITAVLAIAFLGEALTWVTLLGIGFVVGGVCAVALAQAPASAARQPLAPGARRAGVLCALGAALCWATSTALLRPAAEHIDPWVAATLRLMVAALVLLLVTGRRLPAVHKTARLDRGFAIGVLLLGVGTAASMACFVTAVFFAGAARGGALASASPLFGVPIAVLVLKEQVTWRLVAGSALTLVGVWLILLR